ncbi:thiolase family protein [Glutamicibacter sp. JL.03c]|uniref:thiolase family protein n=1 Tax=Glutamicibacter sp. JL.03c TaxID=2984842 RepID=UPI0021F7999E|nr:thiolase family protein [Glutamicibacter sp. JL.03c]UYQ76204.1 thiolase family protein [Glutamicibacter sp. JL.03c]
MNNAYVIDALRTPIVRAGKEYARISADKLIAPVLTALVERKGIAPHKVDHVFLGNAAGPGGNIARVATLASTLPSSVSATSVDAQCTSGLEAISAGARMIRCGEADIVIAGGVESVTTAPWRVEKQASAMTPPRMYSRARFTPEPEPDPDMGVAAENIAKRFEVSRARQDSFALQSHRRAVDAKNSGLYKDELLPVSTPTGLISEDTCPRASIDERKLAALKPAFVSNGSVTAGNSCPINDGAAAVLMVSEEVLHAVNPPFALRYLATATGACAPEILGMAAVPAYEKLAKMLQDTDSAHTHLVEFNEAFAVQALACLEVLGIDPTEVNRDGGALALGHPYGASGAILTTRLFWQAQKLRLDGQRAFALMAAAGGTGSAIAFESVLSGA